MQLLGQILLFCLALAVLQYIVAVLAVAMMLLIIWGLLFRTPETVGLLLFLLFLKALEVQPWATIGVIGLVFGGLLIASVIKDRRGASQEPVALLPPPRGDERN